MTTLKVKLPTDEEKYLIEAIRERIDLNFLCGFIFPQVPRVLIQKLILCFSSSNNYLTPHQFVQLLNVFHPGQEFNVRLQLVLALASRQKFGKNVEEIALSQLNELAEIKNDGNDLKLDDNAVVKWIEDNENSPIIKFLISSSVSNFWNHKTSNDLIISSISGVCHLSSTDISLLDTRFHHLANYSDYLKCDEITDGLAKYIPYDIAHGLVTWFDVNDDAKIDFKEYCCSISSLCRGPDPERYKYIFRVLLTTVETSVNYRSIRDVVSVIEPKLASKIKFSGDEKSREIEFMTEAVTKAKEYSLILHFYSDICHLLFGLRAQTKEEEYELIKRWEVKHSDYVAANTNRKHYMWLIDLKWWKKWEKSLEKNSDRDKSDPKNEVILSLKNLGKDNSDKSNGEIEKMDNSSLFKSVSSTHKFVFDERGHIPKTELGFGNCKPVSEYTFDYLKSRYGPCLIPTCRPVINGVVDFNIKWFNLYRHKYSNTTSHSMADHEKPLALEFDGQAILFKNTTVQIFREDLSRTKRIMLESVRIFEIENLDDKMEKRTLLEDHLKLDGIPKTSALLVEFRKPDLSWPEDLAELARGKIIARKTIKSYEYTGLVNVGNSCYMNAALQALCTTDPLNKYFEQGLAQWETNDSNQNGYHGKLVANFSILISQLAEASIASFAPSKLRNVLASKNSNLCREGDQQDSVELLQVLLDGLHEDLNRVKEKVENQDIPDSNGRDDKLVSQEHWNLFKKQNNSIIIDLFHLQLKSSIECQTCFFNSARFQTELFLHLPVPTDDQILLTIQFFKSSSSIFESKISIASKSKIADLKPKLVEIKISYPVIFACVKNSKFERILADDDLVKPLIHTLIGYRDLGRKYKLFATHRTVNTKKNAGFRKEKFSYFGKPTLIQFDEASDILEAITTELSEHLRTEMPLTKKESKVRCSAEDCDDLLKESVPYRILIVRPDNPAVCGVCSWESLCSGCELTSKTSECVLNEDARLVIHWETVALHFMYKEPVIQRGELQSTSKDFNVINCLKMFEQSEKVEEWKCDKCKEPRTALKQLIPYRFPPVLIIHLKRFEFNLYTMKWMKCTKDIKVQTTLEIHDHFQDKTQYYTFFAAIIHQGSLDGGHYTALCNRNSKWILFNDDQITEIEPSKISEYLSSAYVLLYQRQIDFDSEIKPDLDPTQFKDLEKIIHTKDAKKNSSCDIQ